MRTQPSKMADSRSEARLKVFRLGRGQANGLEFKVHLLDVSARGARLYAGHAFSTGLRMTLACSTVTASGEVRWVDASRFGIRFDVPLVPSELDAIVEAG